MISLLIPTRERPDQCYFLVKTLLEKQYNTNEVLLYVDNDDPQKDYYTTLIHNGLFFHDSVKLFTGILPTVGKIWNFLAHEASGDFLMMGNDDLLCEQNNWDIILENFFYQQGWNDNIGIIWTDDGINGNRHCAFPMVHKKWYSLLHQFTPEQYEFLCNDTHIFDIAKRINRYAYLDTIVFRHNHWSQTHIKDNTTKRHRDDTRNTRIKRDIEKFNSTTCEEERQQLATILLQHINNL